MLKKSDWANLAYREHATNCNNNDNDDDDDEIEMKIIMLQMGHMIDAQPS